MARSYAADIARKAVWRFAVVVAIGMLAFSLLLASGAEAHLPALTIFVETLLVPVNECRKGQSPICITHVVQRGESMPLIAAAYGVTATQIADLNGVVRGRLRPGQKLTLPLVTLEEKVINELERANAATDEKLEIVHEANKFLARRVRELERQLLRSLHVGVGLVIEKRGTQRELASARQWIEALRKQAAERAAYPTDGCRADAP